MLFDYGNIKVQLGKKLYPAQKVLWNKYSYTLDLYDRSKWAYTWDRPNINPVRILTLCRPRSSFGYNSLNREEKRFLLKFIKAVEKFKDIDINYEDFRFKDYFKFSNDCFFKIYFETFEEFMFMANFFSDYITSATVPFSSEHYELIKQNLPNLKYSTSLFRDEYWYRYSVKSRGGKLEEGTVQTLKEVLQMDEIQFHGGRTTASIYTNEEIDPMLLTMAGGGNIKRTQIALIKEDGSVGGINE